MLFVGGGFVYFKGQKKKEFLNLIKIRRGNVVQKVSESGSVEPVKELVLSFEISGKLVKLYVKENQKVKKGTLLVKLDIAKLEIQLKES